VQVGEQLLADEMGRRMAWFPDGERNVILPGDGRDTLFQTGEPGEGIGAQFVQIGVHESDG